MKTGQAARRLGLFFMPLIPSAKRSIGLRISMLAPFDLPPGADRGPWAPTTHVDIAQFCEFATRRRARNKNSGMLSTFCGVKLIAIAER